MEVLELVVWGLEPSPSVSLLELPAHREAWAQQPAGLGPNIASQAPPMITFAAERRAAATFGHYPSPNVLGPPYLSFDAALPARRGPLLATRTTTSRLQETVALSARSCLLCMFSPQHIILKGRASALIVVVEHLIQTMNAFHDACLPAALLRLCLGSAASSASGTLWVP